MTAPQPRMHKRQLGRTLQRLRKEAGKTQEDVAESGVCCTSTLNTIENGIGKAKVKVGTVSALLDLYGIGSGTLRDELKNQAVQTGIKPSYERLIDGAFTQGMFTLLELEQIASTMHEHSESLISGYFQTKSYTEAVFRSVRNTMLANNLPRPDITTFVESRMGRTQKIMKRVDDGLVINYLMSFASVENLVGGPEVMKEQIDHLIEKSEHPNVTISVIPPWLGAHPCIQRRFIILEFDNPDDPTTVYEEGGRSARYIDASLHPIAADQFQRMFDGTAEHCITLKEYLNEH